MQNTNFIRLIKKDDPEVVIEATAKKGNMLVDKRGLVKLRHKYNGMHSIGTEILKRDFERE